MDNAEKLAAYNMFISCLFDLDEPSLRRRKKEKKNTTQYVLDATMHKQTQIT